MYKVLTVLALVLVARSGSDEAEIQRSFERYQEALAKGNGKAAYAQIDSASREYYASILDKTKYATPAECADYGALDKLSILLGRVQIPAADLARFDGEEYFRYAVEQGWVSEVGDASVSVDRIELTDDHALLYIRRQDEVSPFPHIFKKEDGAWKLSLVEMLPVGEEAMQKHLDRVGVEEQDFLFDTVEMAVGVRPTEDTWEPRLRKGE